MNTKLKAYQVGENDIVAAYHEKEAIKVLCDYCGDMEEFDFDESDVTEKHFDLKIHNEDGTFLELLGDTMKDVDTPQYLFGWE